MEINKQQLEKRIISIGTDITIIDSLINFLNLAIEDRADFSNYDVANLTIVIRNMVRIVKTKYDKLEQLLEGTLCHSRLLKIVK